MKRLKWEAHDADVGPSRLCAVRVVRRLRRAGASDHALSRGARAGTSWIPMAHGRECRAWGGGDIPLWRLRRPLARADLQLGLPGDSIWALRSEGERGRVRSMTPVGDVSRDSLTGVQIRIGQ
jgi:hypothetical protein